MTYRDCDNDCRPGACQDYPCAELTGTPAPFWVYVAGRLSGDPGVYLANVANLSLWSRRLIEAGFCPVNPAADLLDGLMGVDPLSVALYQKRSSELLSLLAYPATFGRAAMLVTSTHHRDGSPSGGVHNEIDLCGQLEIPTVTTMRELFEMRARTS